MRRKYSVASKFRKPLSLDGLYYSHGLMCASYPRTVVALVAFVVIVCSLPFFVTPSGDLNKPKYWRSPWLNYRIQATPQTIRRGEEPEWIINKPSQSSGRTPSWFVGLPVAVVQQVYVNLEINCQQVEQLCDKSYYSASKLASAQLLSRMEQAISACQPVIHPAAANLTRILSLYDPSPPLPSPRPLNGILSPVLDSFRIKWEDMPLGYHSIKELMYGGFWEHQHRASGAGQRDPSPSPSPSPGTHKQHTLAMTLLLHVKRREDFQQLVQCVEGVKDLWPDVEEKQGSLRFMKHFYYEPEWSLLDFAPLMGVYSIVFLYISFSVGKIDLVKSKIGLGFTAFVTVVAGLTMSLGICTFFGLSISLSGSEIYPYVVIVIGLENILIIVKAVMSTPEELEVKYRIAVGLSKEGWAITRNLITLAFMTSMGIVFFNYVLKEFCIIALVGLLCDTFLQLVFFPTVLSIDLRRLELTDLSSTAVPVPDIVEKTGSHSCRPRCPASLQVATPMRWRSKRIKFIYFLARTRIVSRILMLSFFVLLCALFIKTHTFHNLIGYFHSGAETTPSPNQHTPGTDAIHIPDPGGTDFMFSPEPPTEPSSQHVYRGQEAGEGMGSAYWTELLSTLNQSGISISRRRENGFRVQCENGEVCWRPMVTTHWPRLLGHTGVNMDGRFLTLLPPIYLDFFLGYTPTTLPPSPVPSLVMRIVYHSLIIRVSSVVGFLVVVGCYVCGLIRSSKFRHERYMRSVRLRGYNRMVCLKGHSQDVDYLCVDSGLVVTTGLDGDIRVWDANPMKRRCARVIARSELCREPPAEVSSSSHRPAAEGCEAADALTSMKHPGFSRRGSTVSYLSSISDHFDHHGNRVGPRSASRLSSVSSWEHLDQPRSSTALQGMEGTQDSLMHTHLLPNYTRDTSTPSSPVLTQLPLNHAHQDTSTPPSPVLPPVRQFPSQMTDMGGLYTFPHATVGSALRSNSFPPHRHVVAASSSTALPYSRATTGAPDLSPAPTDKRSSAGSDTGRTLTDTRSSNSAIMTHPPPQNPTHPPNPIQNRPQLIQEPRPSWNNSDISKPHPNHTSQHKLPSPLSNPTFCEFPRPPPLQSHMHGPSLPHSQNSVSSVSTVVSKPPSRSHVHGLSSLHLQTSASAVSAVLGSSSLCEDLMDASCVHVQLEPEFPACSNAASSSASVGLSTGAAARDLRLGLVQSHSHPSLTMLPNSNSSLQPVTHSRSSANVPSSPSNLRISQGHNQVPCSDGRSEVPDIKVDGLSGSGANTLPGSSGDISHMRRLGHSRHLSLGRNTSTQQPTHSRHRSLGSINPSQFTPLSTLNSTHGSHSNLSMMSNASICDSDISNSSNFLKPSQLTRLPDPDRGYDFAQHFNLFSQYTSNMALEFCMSGRCSEERLPTVPPVWCMAFSNRVVAVGCSNGQLEAWNASTGSLIFNLNIGSTGIGSIAMSSAGIATGQMDGTLSLISYNGLLYHCVPAHDKAIGVMHCYGNKIITGSYDSAVKVHCISTSSNSLVCVNSVHVHEGNITAVTVVESQLKLGCVSGCSKGLVIHWDINSGNCICDFGLYKSAVLQLEPTISCVVGLFGEGCVRVWDIVAGYLLHTIALDGVCHDLTVLSSQHIAVCSESSVEVYDLESGKPYLEKQLETERGSMSLVRHVQALDGASVVCSSGKDVYIVPCDLKLKNE